LKEDYRECTLNEALVLAAQVLAKSMDSATPSVDKYEIGVLQKDAAGNVVQRRIEGAELKEILDKAKVFE
jgi:20S proteasome alpha/beta subunit